VGKYGTLGIVFDRIFRNTLNKALDDVDTDIQAQKKRVDDLIVGTQQPSEVVDSRGGFPVLGDRLNDVTSKLSQKAKQYRVDVTDSQFGAKGDGVTNDTTAIQAAIDYAQTLVTNRFLNGAEVFFPKGTYLISNTLTITSSNICLSGESISSSVLYAPSSNFDLVHFNGTSLSLYAVGIKNLRIYTPTDATGGFHVRLTKCINSMFTNLYLVGWYNGIAVDGGGKIYIDNVILSQENRTAGTSNYAIDFLDTNGINADVHLSNIQVVPDLTKSATHTVSVRSSDGIYFSNLHMHGGFLLQPNNVGNGQTLASIFFSNCYFDRSNDANFAFVGSANSYRNFMFDNCYFRDAVNGVVFNASTLVSRIQFSNCSFSQQDNSGVDCKNSNVSELIFNSCIYSDNNTVNNNAYGDMLLQGVNVIVNACTFKGGGALGYGVYFKAGLSKSAIAACTLTESTTTKKFVNSGTVNKTGVLSGVTLKNRGSAALSSGSTSVTVTHGLSVTPSLEQILIMARSLKSGSGDLYPTNITATTFDIVSQSAPSVSVSITWWVDTTS
jgi:hypothetical protein